MQWLRRFVRGFAPLLRWRRAEQELDDELRAYLEAGVHEKMRAGLSREQALRAARVDIGSLEAVKDRTRDVGWETALESVWRDVRYSARVLRQSPGFTLAVVVALALGLGATTAIFGLLDAVILKSLPVKNPEELVLVRSPGHYGVFQAFREESEAFVDLFGSGGVTALDVEIEGGLRERASISLVSGAYFSTLGVAAARGRTFTADDDRVPGQHAVAVIGDGYWQRRFGRDPRVLGQTIRIGSIPITIIGVTPPGFFGEEVGAAPDLWVPLTMWGHVVPGRNLLQSPGTSWVRMVGRIRPGIEMAQAEARLTSIAQREVADVFSGDPADEVQKEIAGIRVRLAPANNGVSNLRARFARPLQLMMGAVAVVLLIACANIANLLLARAAARQREIDVRLALGLSRGRLIRQLLTESLLLAAVGGAAGLGVAWLSREALLRLISADGSRVPVAAETDARLLVFVTVLSFGTAILFGLAPAWQSARTAIVKSLIGRGEQGRPARVSALLVVTQVALSLVLLMSAGLFLRTLANLRDVDLGFAAERLLILDVNPHAAGYTGEGFLALTARLLGRLAEIPGVSSASVAENGVLMGRNSSTNLMRAAGFVAGPEGFPRTHFDWIGPRYFATMGIPLLAGREFGERDDARATPVVAINEEMARRFFGDANPIGERLLWGAAGSLEIVAVTGGVRHSGPRDDVQMRFYLPLLQLPQIRPNWIPASSRLVVRTAADPAAIAPVLRQAVASEEPRLSVASLDAGPDLVSRTLVQERMVATLLAAFAVLAAGLACLGLYGLMAYHAVQRTSEIGIRMALGAAPDAVLRGILGQGLRWIAAGVAIGVPLALSASRLARNLLFGLSPADPATLAGAAAVMSLIGLLAGYVPARRASRVDPAVALRHD
jgi:predicted permease